MKQGARGFIERALSRAALMGLMTLSFCVCQAWAATEVLNVPPRFATHTAGSYASLTQYFRAVCDSITYVSFYNGWHPGAGSFTAELRDSARDSLVWNGSRPTAESLAYRDVGFTVNKGVNRGKTYKLIIGYTWNSSGPNYYLDVYYDTTNVYRYGKMYLYGDSVDLCVRVAGTGRILDVWGMNSHLTNKDYKSPSIDTMLTYCVEEGVKFIREPVGWRWIQPNDSSTFNWTRIDSVLREAKEKDIKVSWMFWGSPPWGHTRPNPDTCCCVNDTFYYNHPPRGLNKPVFKSGTGEINPANLFGYYAYQVAKHCQDSSFEVEYWEIWNEQNSVTAWDYPRTDSLGYPNVTTPESLIALYKRLVVVADSAIHSVDSQAKLVLGGLERVRVHVESTDKCGHTVGHPFAGVWWLDKFLAQGGGQYIDTYAFHPYQNPELPPPWGRVRGDSLQKDVDTLRQILRARGQNDKPLWANEVGYAGSKYTGNGRRKADLFVQFHAITIEQGTNPLGPVDKLMWYQLLNRWDYSHPYSQIKDYWWAFCGVANCSTHVADTVHYAAKQMSAKLKNLYYNRRVPVGTPSDSLYCYEFQVPGADTLLKTWCLWRTAGAEEETLSIRTNVTRLVTRHDGGDPDSVLIDTNPLGDYGKILENGKIVIYDARMDIVPRYLHEIGPVSRPDVIVDSLWLVPSDPRAGEGLRFYARIKNISKDSLKASLPDTVIFQVDGVTKARYAATRGLDTLGGPKDTLTVGYIGVAPVPDWYATWGDHLIRAWVDSSDKYVELREDNNRGYIFKHIRPKVSLIINSGAKYSNHLSNNEDGGNQVTGDS